MCVRERERERERGERVPIKPKNRNNNKIITDREVNALHLPTDKMEKKQPFSTVLNCIDCTHLVPCVTVSCLHLTYI